MNGDLVVTRTLRLPASELSWRFSRSAGPGGQGVNTTDSRVELAFDVVGSTTLTDHQRQRVLDRLARRVVDGRLVVTASEHRSQLRNREAAASRLAQLLREALAPDPARRRATRPTLGSQRRRLDAKTRRGETKRLRRPPQS